CYFPKSPPRRLLHSPAHARGPEHLRPNETEISHGRASWQGFRSHNSTRTRVRVELCNDVRTNPQLFRARSSILFQSSAIQCSFGAGMLSWRCARDDVPGIGNMTGDFCSNQASASCTTLTL